jgi:hypothetical protein
MKPSEQLKEWGYVQEVNNMGTIIWVRSSADKYIRETLHFSFHNNPYYLAFVYIGTTKRPMEISVDFHNLLDEYIKKELYWK